jgi:VCBS repeat-containing protein
MQRRWEKITRARRKNVVCPLLRTAHQLLAGASVLPADSVSSNTTLQTDAQGLLDYAQTITNSGEELMFTMDVPSVPVQETPIVLAQAAAPGAGVAPQPDYLLIGCNDTTSGDYQNTAENGVDPAGGLAIFLGNLRGHDIYNDPTALASIKITLLEGTTHGKLVPHTRGAGGVYFMYEAEHGYKGKDRAVFMAVFEGKTYKMVFDLNVYPVATIADNMPSTCPAEPTFIKLNPKPASGSSGYDSGYSLGSLTVTFADLVGGAVGQTVGTNITLDSTAAGNGWFIDTTPADNSEYLPTSNPNEWVAKAGSDAAGKMDMLSVLLHEYGHALGIEHSADSGDYMGTTLTVGVRRLPSATELALMQQLIGQAKDGLAAAPTLTLPQGERGQDAPFPTLPFSLGGLAFAGLLRPNRYGSSSIDVVTTQYEAAANATFTNLDTAGAWQTQGNVDITPSSFDTSGRTVVSSATLNEISTAQTRLSQVFMLGANDRYLSFTLSGSVLDNPVGAPEDAFEVALLDASTGASVLTGDGLTRTDAFLNLQADGTQNAADCVTCINNADGSRTYRVDLTGVAKNIAVNLSFDLLGFGASNSHVTLRDIRTSGLPQLRDDIATLAEDNLLTFDPFSQADAQLKPLLASHIVAAPTHGVLAMNANGTFAYTPDLNYFGADSFSYNLSDGSLDSNLATVSLTVTPVNDAPVVADVQATTAEDTPLVIALGAYATDVDSTTLTTQIVAGPAHGVLVQNNDGSYSYTPDANYNGADSFTYKANDGELDSNVATVTLGITPVNDAPVAGDLNLAAVEDTALKMNLLVAASDVENDALTAAIVATAQHGQVNINADGSFTYTPVANYNGIDSFTYKVNDGALDSNVATVNLSIAAVNDAPVVADVQDAVAPAQAGAQSVQTLDSGLRRNDGSNNFAASRQPHAEWGAMESPLIRASSSQPKK